MNIPEKPPSGQQPAMDQMRPSGHRALRKGRNPVPHGRYFLSCVVAGRRRGLEKVAADLVQIGLGIESESLWRMKALVAMPDHVHLLVELGQAGDLAGCVRRFKGRSAQCLRRLGLSWQRGAYHDHRLRPTEDLGAFLRYMLLNPYRASLIDWEDPWPGWWRAEDAGAWFDPTTLRGRPRPEWVSEAERLARDMGAGPVGGGER